MADAGADGIAWYIRVRRSVTAARPWGLLVGCPADEPLPLVDWPGAATHYLDRRHAQDVVAALPNPTRLEVVRVFG